MSEAPRWPAAVPSHWTRCQAQYALDYVSRPPRPEDEIVTAFRDGQVTLRRNRREEGFTNALKEIGYQHISRGDLVVHSMDGGFGAIGVSDSDGKASPVVHAYRSERCDLYFMAYFLRAAIGAGWIAAQVKGIRERSTQFDRASLARLEVAFPSLPEQRSIVAFLDRETAEIDAMDAELDRLVETLRERRASAVQEAVADFEGRWPRVAIQLLAQIGSGDGIPSEDIADEGRYPVYGGNGRRGYTDRFNETENRVLVGRQGALCGNVHLAEGPFWASEHALVLRTTQEVHLEWLAYAVRDQDLGRLSVAAAQPGITASGVGREKVALPPLMEQRRIAAELDEQTARIDDVIADAQRLKALLAERRSTLITDVVTGRKEVPA